MTDFDPMAVRNRIAYRELSHDPLTGRRIDIYRKLNDSEADLGVVLEQIKNRDRSIAELRKYLEWYHREDTCRFCSSPQMVCFIEALLENEPCHICGEPGVGFCDGNGNRECANHGKFGGEA